MDLPDFEFPKPNLLSGIYPFSVPTVTYLPVFASKTVLDLPVFGSHCTLSTGFQFPNLILCMLPGTKNLRKTYGKSNNLPVFSSLDNGDAYLMKNEVNKMRLFGMQFAK